MENSKLKNFFDEYKIDKRESNANTDLNTLIRQFASKKKLEKKEAIISMSKNNISVKDLIYANLNDIHSTWIRDIIEYYTSQGFTANESKLTMCYIVEYYKEMFKEILPDSTKEQWKGLMHTALYKSFNKDRLFLKENVDCIIKIKEILNEYENNEVIYSDVDNVHRKMSILNTLYKDLSWCLLTSINFCHSGKISRVIREIEEHKLALNYLNTINFNNVFSKKHLPIDDSYTENLKLYKYYTCANLNNALSEIAANNTIDASTNFKMYVIAKKCRGLKLDIFNSTELDILHSQLNTFEIIILENLQNKEYNHDVEYHFNNLISSITYYYNLYSSSENWYKAIFNDYKVTKNLFYFSTIKKALIKLINRENDAFIYFQSITFELFCHGKCFEEYCKNGYFIANEDNTLNLEAIKKGIKDKVWIHQCRSLLIHKLKMLVDSKIDNNSISPLLKEIFSFYKNENLFKTASNDDLKRIIYDVFCKNISKTNSTFEILEENEFRQREDGILWEKLCGLIIKELYNNYQIDYHPYLSNGMIPDYMITKKNSKIIIETKKSCYFMKSSGEQLNLIDSKEFINYSDYCDELEFWILEKTSIKNIEKPKNVKIRFANEILKNIDQDSYIHVATKEISKKSKLTNDEYILSWIEENNIIKKIEDIFQSL